MSTRKLIVVKLGTSTLTDENHALSRPRMLEITRQLVLLRQEGFGVVVVTSGAVSAGREVMAKKRSDRSLPLKQMLASIGQVRLMHLWSEFFANYRVVVGQVLLSRSDFVNRVHYLNIRDTLLTLLSHGVIPIVNENDVVAVKRMRFGDNDTLSALVANLIDADLLALMTDQEGLFTADPRLDPTAKLIPIVAKIEEGHLLAATGSGTAVGTGGMATKLTAARLAVESGTEVVIASSLAHDSIIRVAHGETMGTRFVARHQPLESRKRWLLAEEPQGGIIIDPGAELSLKARGSSLLPKGVVQVVGTFNRGALVDILSNEGHRVAVGLASYSSEELERIIGLHSKEIEKTLGYSRGDEVVHRDQLTMMRQSHDKSE